MIGMTEIIIIMTKMTGKEKKIKLVVDFDHKKFSFIYFIIARITGSKKRRLSDTPNIFLIYLISLLLTSCYVYKTSGH